MESDKITVRQFKNCWFNKDYSEISEERFQVCYEEYADISGLYKNKSFDDYSTIIYLSNRVSAVSIAIQVQRDMVNAYGEPYVDGLSFFEQYGHNVRWNGNAKEFTDYLYKIERKERKYKLELDNKKKQFSDENREKMSVTQTRQEFIISVNNLNKKGYFIDWDKTTVEELSLMIKQDRDERN